MGQVKTFFFDTFAFFESIKGNENYRPYLHDVGIVTTRLNLMELYHGLLVTSGKAVAEKYYSEFLPFCVDPDEDSYKEAAELRYRLKRQNLSYIDCMGYILARKNGVRFLTGDKQFEGMDNVEFVR